METYTVLKVNVAGTGYTNIWPVGSPMFDLRTLDASLPVMETRSAGKCIAYSATWVQTTQILIAVGVYWPQHKDEYGRAGLSFWHGVNCIFSHQDKDIDILMRISDLLLGMVQKYEVDYERVGILLAQVAQKKETNDWVNVLTRMSLETSLNAKDFAQSAVYSFTHHLITVPNQTNLRVSIPFHADMVIPYLMILLLKRKGVQRIGGGKLSDLQLKEYDFISISKEVKSHKTLDISNMFVASYDKKESVDIASLTGANPVSAETSRWNTGAVSLYILLALLLLLLFMVATFFRV
jgi:hypothetical protein